MKKALRRSVLLFACVIALSFAAGLLLRYVQDSGPGSALLSKKDVLRALRQEELDPRSAETWHFRMTFDTAEMFVYQCDESNTMTVYLYVFKTVEQREAASASLLQMGFLMPYPTFYAKNILLYAEFFARESENMAKLERAAVWMGGDITRLDLP